MHLSPLSEENEAVTVCGGRIKDAIRYPSALYRDRRVYFCTHACLQAFEAAPDPFMAGDIEHPTEED